MLNVITFEIGDLARIDHPLLGLTRTERLRRVFILTNIQTILNKDQIRLEWEEIPTESELDQLRRAEC